MGVASEGERIGLLKNAVGKRGGQERMLIVFN